MMLTTPIRPLTAWRAGGGKRALQQDRGSAAIEPIWLLHYGITPQEFLIQSKVVENLAP